MEKTKNIVYILAGIFLVSLFLGCVGTKETKLEPRADGKALYDYITVGNNYKTWKMWPGTGEMYPRSTEKPSEPHGVFLTTYVSDNAYSDIVAKKGILPDESIIVKENYDADKKLAALTVMYKEKGYDPEHNDWFWVKYQPNGTIDAQGKVKGCIDCHDLPKDMFKDKSNDYIWSGDLS
ncbi:MAG: cytochrome P460 family protein [Candidatus Methanoperedens sp.]|nr:cytochrome P460 family protein [Candidatus Methanoperedens sp.]MCZ7361256.1 cytochrome P460 family protein [Candidatus Methanoperedens sp.]HLB71164.1 cytochrome P460 family protein [Candidatus Methanoperedens sp.]